MIRHSPLLLFREAVSDWGPSLLNEFRKLTLQLEALMNESGERLAKATFLVLVDEDTQLTGIPLTPSAIVPVIAPRSIDCSTSTRHRAIPRAAAKFNVYCVAVPSRAKTDLLARVVTSA